MLETIRGGVMKKNRSLFDALMEIDNIDLEEDSKKTSSPRTKKAHFKPHNQDIKKAKEVKAPKQEKMLDNKRHYKSMLYDLLREGK